jgi:hypothetical protein
VLPVALQTRLKIVFVFFQAFIWASRALAWQNLPLSALALVFGIRDPVPKLKF